MEIWPEIVRKQINELNENLKDLTSSIKESSQSSDRLQKRLIFLTVVMAIAAIAQAVAIFIQIFK